MFLIRPTEEGPDAYNELEAKFTALQFQEIFQLMEPAYGEIELPRMKMEFQANLKDALQDIGVRRAIILNDIIVQGSTNCSPETPAETSRP